MNPPGSRNARISCSFRFLFSKIKGTWTEYCTDGNVPIDAKHGH